jgi:hypothetical protein
VLDPRKTYSSAGKHARHAQRTAVKLAFSGIGFSAAYFLDPEHGASRRGQAIEFIRRGKEAIARTRARKVDGDATFALADALVPDPLANGSQPAGDGLRIAR